MAIQIFNHLQDKMWVRTFFRSIVTFITIWTKQFQGYSKVSSSAASDGIDVIRHLDESGSCKRRYRIVQYQFSSGHRLAAATRKVG